MSPEASRAQLTVVPCTDRAQWDDTVNALLSVGRTIGVDTSVIAAGGSGDSSHTVVDYTYYDSDVRTVTHTAVSLLVDLLLHPVQSA